MSNDIDLDLATSRPHADLLADIVGHPEGQPLISELSYMNPDLAEEASRSHLSRLEEAGFVEGAPGGGFRLSGEAREALDEADVFPEGTWQRLYDRVEE